MQEKKSRTPNETRTARTRAALLDAARRLFAEKGYADTGTPEIVRTAGVTRGALYHHFEDKRALFRALVEAENAAVAEAIDQAVGEPRSALQALKSGARAYFKAMQAPGRTRLLLMEGPAVLGWDEMKAIDDAGSGNTLATGLQLAMNAGELRRIPVGALSALFNAAFDRAALEIAAGMAESDAIDAIDAMIDGISA